MRGFEVKRGDVWTQKEAGNRREEWVFLHLLVRVNLALALTSLVVLLQPTPAGR